MKAPASGPACGRRQPGCHSARAKTAGAHPQACALPPSGAGCAVARRGGLRRLPYYPRVSSPAQFHFPQVRLLFFIVFNSKRKATLLGWRSQRTLQSLTRSDMHPRAPRAHAGVPAHTRVHAPRTARRARTPSHARANARCVRPGTRGRGRTCPVLTAGASTLCVIVLFPTEDPPKGKRSVRAPPPRPHVILKVVTGQGLDGDKSGDGTSVNAGQHRGTSEDTVTRRPGQHFPGHMC